jgi:tellurite methyltransferase
MDVKYWDNYYKQHGKDKQISESSSFADFCLNKFFAGKYINIVELGSGNGRDAIYFARHQINTIAIDQSTVAIDIEKELLLPEVGKFLHPKALDFVLEDYSTYEPIDVFYSRFTMHAITENEENILLPNLYKYLKTGGLLCIEARTTKDALYGEGECCGKDTFYTDHSRRFVNSKNFLEKVLKMGFGLVYFTEENNLSVYKDDNPVLMRIILKKTVN